MVSRVLVSVTSVLTFTLGLRTIPTCAPTENATPHMLVLRDVKTGKKYYCGAERLSQLYPVMATKKYKPAMKAELMEGKGVERPQLGVEGTFHCALCFCVVFAQNMHITGFGTWTACTGSIYSNLLQEAI